MCRFQLLARGLLPAAHEARHLFGGEKPQAIEEVDDGVVVRAELPFDLFVCLVGVGTLILDALDLVEFRLDPDLLDGVGPGQEERLVVRLVQLVLEDDRGRGIQGRVAHL